MVTYYCILFVFFVLSIVFLFVQKYFNHEIKVLMGCVSFGGFIILGIYVFFHIPRVIVVENHYKHSKEWCFMGTYKTKDNVVHKLKEGETYIYNNSDQVVGLYSIYYGRKSSYDSFPIGGKRDLEEKNTWAPQEFVVCLTEPDFYFDIPRSITVKGRRNEAYRTTLLYKDI